jgi:hypothetical protein
MIFFTFARSFFDFSTTSSIERCSPSVILTASASVAAVLDAAARPFVVFS